MVYLFVSLLVCHYVADYCLTTHGMIAAKAKGKPWFPIAGHAAIHAILMGAVLLAFGIGWKLCVLLSFIQWVSHFIIDTTKGMLTARFPLLADNTRKPFWMLYGLDQLLHLLIIVVMTTLA